MSPKRGNIKISQLSELGVIENGAKLKIPASKDKSATSTPNWVSYGVTADVLSNFMEKSLGFSDVDFTKGLRSKVADLQTQIGEYGELEKKLGRYNLVTHIDLAVNKNNYYLSTSGKQISKTGYVITNKVSLSRGNLYLFKVEGSENFLADVSLMSKVHTHQYTTPSGSTATETVYEPLPTHYYSSNAGGNGIPSAGYFVFFATEDMDVVISSSAPSIISGLDAVKYGAFIEIADKLLTINGNLMKVIVEAIVKNRKDIDSFCENLKFLGNIHVNSIDCNDYPSVQGSPRVIVSDREPSSASATHGDDIPTKLGQIWIYTRGPSVFIATGVGDIYGWSLIFETMPT